MSTTFSPTLSQQRRTARVLFLVLAFAPSAHSFAQTAAKPPVAEAMLNLPDSPGAISSSSLASSDSSNSAIEEPASVAFIPAFKPALNAAFQSQAPSGNGVVAGQLTKYIQPGVQAPKLRVGDKILLGLKDTVSPLSAAGWVLSAGYAQAVNGTPNYGTNGKAFAQRLGAAAARNVSEGVFSDSVMASILHEDPRYYKMGAGHNVLKRLVYAGTRPIITRTDGGRQTINFAYLGGNLAGSALTQAYYPPVNRGFNQVLQTFGGSIGGGAIGFVASEFLGDILQAVHLQKAK